jgi:hypothetical protein
MPDPYINDDAPPGIKFHATPMNAVIGPSDRTRPCRT